MEWLYVLMFLSLWSMGLILLGGNGRNEFTRWIGGFMLIGGCGSFGVSCIVNFLPFFTPGSALYESVRNVGVFALIIYIFVLPFMFLCSTLIFIGWLKGNWKWVLVAALLLTPLVSFEAHVHISIDLVVYDVEGIRYWAGVYVFLAIGAFIYGYWREKDSEMKRNRLRTGMVFSIAMLWAYGMDYVGVDRWRIDKGEFITEGSTLWQLNYIIVLWLVIFFVYYGIRYGFLGIKLRIEQQKIDYSMRALTVGTSILNHNIKNEVQKLRYLAERTQDSLLHEDREKAIQSLNNIRMISDQMQQMVTRMKDRAEEIVLHEEVHRLAELIESIVCPLEETLKEKGIYLNYEVVHDVYCMCDAIHVRETINNVVSNAIDAVKPGEGTVDVTLFLHGGDAIIDVRDNGSGIAQDNLPRIFEPFFSTKKKMSNFGLGLSYSFSVMQKHGGMLTVASEQNLGTAVMLRFPKKRIVNSPAAKGAVAE